MRAGVGGYGSRMRNTSKSSRVPPVAAMAKSTSSPYRGQSATSSRSLARPTCSKRSRTAIASSSSPANGPAISL